MSASHFHIDKDTPASFFGEKGDFKRPGSIFRDFISTTPGARFPAEANRYHLYVSFACPWAHRTLIARKLKGLEPLIPVTVAHYFMEATGDARGWKFVSDDDPEASPGQNIMPDPLHPDFTHIRQLYLLADSNYTGRFSVPVLWDKIQNTVVNNESSEIIRMFNSEFNHLLPKEFAQVDLYPKSLRQDIDAVESWHVTNLPTRLL